MFMEVESYFIDVKFYMKNDVIWEVFLAIIHSTKNTKFKKEVEQFEATLIGEISKPRMTLIEDKEKSLERSTSNLINTTPLVFRYVSRT